MLMYDSGVCMNRRQFLRAMTAFFASLGMGRITLRARETKRVSGVLRDILIIDAHAHPAQMLRSESKLATRALAIKNMKQLGAVTSSFSAVGDIQKGSDFYDRIPATYEQIIEQLNRAKEVIESTGAKIVRKSSDIPKPSDSGNTISALLALEGAEPLEGDSGKIDDLYQYGVRIVTLMHYRVSAFGDIMTAPPKHNGLTAEGKKLIENMQKMGIVIDVAHTHMSTLRDIVKINGKPVIDSHTALSYALKPGVGRTRTFKEMEMVAEGGGVVCTWLLAVTKKTPRRETFIDWAKEIKAIKERIGIEHVGLGTDTGGYVKGTTLITGYRNITDLVKLAEAMLEVGLTKDDISAFMGGNLLRVVKACIG